MKTMTQHEKNDYDIDDGAAFAADKLKTKGGVSFTPQEAKEMVRDALIEGGGLAKNPTVKKNCVRVKYAAGHHVDIPVYRILSGRKELAGETWRDSNPTEITEWFATAEKSTQREGDAEPQLRRVVRLVKRYSRRNLEGNSLSGLILTVLTAEKHTAYDAREDRAFREVLRQIRNRLLVNVTVNNPANSTESLTKDSDTAKVIALVDAIAKSLETLESSTAQTAAAPGTESVEGSSQNGLLRYRDQERGGARKGAGFCSYRGYLVCAKALGFVISAQMLLADRPRRAQLEELAQRFPFLHFCPRMAKLLQS